MAYERLSAIAAEQSERARQLERSAAERAAALMAAELAEARAAREEGARAAEQSEMQSA